MKRYDVPRLMFINKCDRMGANPFRVIDMARDKLRLNAAAVQLPIGLEDHHAGGERTVLTGSSCPMGAQHPQPSSLHPSISHPATNLQAWYASWSVAPRVSRD